MPEEDKRKIVTFNVYEVDENDNIIDEVPLEGGMWCFGIVKRKNQYIFAEIITLEEENGEVKIGWCPAATDFASQEIFNKVLEEEGPEFYELSDGNFEKYQSWILKDLIRIIDKPEDLE